ncbi:MAG: histidine kinase [Kordiimonadales bacterium]|nr:MAG: histidine kinase [Kordiimonadales bacterium]
MGFKRFSIFLGIRLIIIMVALLGLTFLYNAERFFASTILAFAVVVVLSFEMIRFVSKTNAEVTRFLDAARYADFGQRFNFQGMGAGFGDLGDTFTDILKRFQVVRATKEAELRHLKALIEHVPSPLISVHADEKLTLWNNAARRLFGSAHVTRITDLAQFGDDFKKEVRDIKAGQRRLVTFEVDGIEQRLTIASTQIIIGGHIERLVSLQDIQSELDAAQLQAWQDLVRVLTHEIMNSITPVASLAKTAVDLVDDVLGKIEGQPEILEELNDVKDAVNTVARRSDNLMKFVSSYRSLTRLPPPEKSLIRIDDLLAGVAKVATQGWNERGLSLVSSVEPSELDVMADRDMVEQVLINLLQNAGQALEGTKDGTVWLNSHLNKRGHIIIEVVDNGPGIPADIAKKIFVPFFTTKREGSGVGLALTRQVMIAHGGAVSVAEREEGGAKFTLTF